MGRSTRSQETAVALQIEVELGGVCYGGVDDGSCGTIARSISLIRVVGEKPDVMALSDDDERDRRLDAHLLACRC